MPPKRRIRNGSTPTTSSLHTLKSNVAAAAAAAAASNAILQNNNSSTSSITTSTTTTTTNNNHHYQTKFNHNNIHHNNINNNALRIGGGSINSGDGLTTKQKQQLDRNNYLSTLTKDQLKIECRKRGQKVTGTKIELLQRLGFKMSNTQPSTNNTTNTISNRQSSGNNSKSNVAATTPNGSSSSVNQSFVRKQNAKDKERERAEREKLVLWRHPILTLTYCCHEIVILLQTYRKKLAGHKLLIGLFFGLIALLCVFNNVPGRHQVLFGAVRANLWFVIYWVGLGVLSSVGLGTGLHTFLLYLGPHIASVTIAAYECNSLDFPQPPYPDEIICPENGSQSSVIPSLLSIMSKVRYEAFLWGAGTALGELPPYFMAKAARLSGYDPEDEEELKEFEELKKKSESGVQLNILDRAKVAMERVVERVGFLGILACASIPNPLFDLAGITCGHFLVPFWTFFGATLIGKAIIKMHIQKMFVIIAFNESLIQRAVDLLGALPTGKLLQEPFKSFLQNQKTRLHRSSKRPPKESGNVLAKIFEAFVVLMILYFVISIINSFAQSYHKRIHKKGGKVYRKVAKD